MSKKKARITTTAGWTGIQLLSPSDKELLGIQLAAFGVNLCLSILVPLPFISTLRYLALSAITAARGSVGNGVLDVASPIGGALLFLLLVATLASLLTYPFIHRPSLNSTAIVYKKREPTNIEINHPIFLPWPIFKVQYIDLGLHDIRLPYELTFIGDLNSVKVTLLIRYRVVPDFKWAFAAWGSEEGIKAELRTKLSDRLIDWSQSLDEGALNFVEAYERPELIRDLARKTDTKDMGILITDVRIPQPMEITGPLKERNEDQRIVAEVIRQRDAETRHVLRLRASEQRERFRRHNSNDLTEN